MDENGRRRLAAFLRLFETHRLDELIVEDGELKVRLRSARAQARKAVQARPVSRPTSPAADVSAKRPRTVAVRSPLIGVFYRAASPDAPPFVEVGDLVEEGQTVCIVEAMKVFNEIKAEWRGRVVAIPVESGRLVQAGEPLVVLEFVQD
jgi:acetyl-CoA carboxylase biotin carboxyl carrier protein